MAFDLILKAALKPVSSKCFWRLFLGTEVMLVLGRASRVRQAQRGLKPRRRRESDPWG